MPRFYHVNRVQPPYQQPLTVGQTIDIVQQVPPDSRPPELATVADQLFPNGMTQHGWNHLWNRALDVSAYMEIIMDLVRRTEFPSKRSRYESVFAFETLADAQTFRIRYPAHGQNFVGQAQIVQVDGHSAHKANMALLDGWANATVAIKAARDYWSGNRGLAPELWEHLLIPPVTITGTI